MHFKPKRVGFADGQFAGARKSLRTGDVGFAPLVPSSVIVVLLFLFGEATAN